MVEGIQEAEGDEAPRYGLTARPPRAEQGGDGAQGPGGGGTGKTSGTTSLEDVLKGMWNSGKG